MKNKSSIIFICLIFLMYVSSEGKVSSSIITKHKVYWGSAASPFRGEKDITGVQAWIRLNDQIKSLNGGFGLQARRSYDRGIPFSFQASAMAPDTALCPVSIGSFKPSWKETADGGNNLAIKKFIQSIPDKREVYLIFHHEPEDEAEGGKDGRSPELLKAAFAKFVEVVLESGKSNVHPCFVLMTWTFNPKSHRNPDDFNLGANLKPEQRKKVIAGLDGYASVPTFGSAKSIFEPNFAKLASWGFKRFGIFETAVHSDETANGRADWIRSLGEWVNSRNDIELVTWFHAGNGQHAGEKGWYLGDWEVQNGMYSWSDKSGSIAEYSKLMVP